MSNPSVSICVTALDVDEAATGIKNLSALTDSNLVKIVFAPGKVEAQHPIKVFKIEAGYPASIPHLQTLARWADCTDPSEARFRDGYDIFCLRTALAQNFKSDFVILLRDVVAFEKDWTGAQAAMTDALFWTSDVQSGGHPENVMSPNVAINLRDGRASDFLEEAWELYATGAAYGCSPYRLNDVLLMAERCASVSKKNATPAVICP